jgi:hypothetical protein
VIRPCIQPLNPSQTFATTIEQRDLSEDVQQDDQLEGPSGLVAMSAMPLSDGKRPQRTPPQVAGGPP